MSSQRRPGSSGPSGAFMPGMSSRRRPGSCGPSGAFMPGMSSRRRPGSSGASGAFLALVASLCFGSWVPASAGMTLSGRTYEIHLPNGRAPGEPAPLVLVFHGGGANAANAMRMSGMNAKSDAEGFIVAYPNGTGPRRDSFLTWNAWRCCGLALERKVDDVAFVRALVDEVARRYPVDRKRVYATGFSNGGMLTYRLGCELGDVFAAIAPVAGALN